jgi:bifunctional non-homologous end joining protein LigD
MNLVKLKEYKEKRDFSKTKEPKGSRGARGIFVVQEHDASRLHWDFRIEVKGVLPSWVITKEPNYKDKRLAVKTEDHPLEYAKFHGTIPKGEYGAGAVKIWDNGKYENLRKISIEKSIKEGKIEINLEGKKLNGAFALIRMKPNSRYKAENNWLFFKMKK